MPSTSAFAAVLRDYRAQVGFTQEELAERSGLSVRAIRNLEVGRTVTPQRQSVRLLAAALRLAAADHATLLAAARKFPSGRCELPPDVPELVGRADDVAALVRLLTTSGFAVVSGGPGTGRTALAVHVAHRVRERFPDGQVFADLDGAPSVLGRVLRSLNASVPASRDERAALVRAHLTARRVLVVLDNVASEAQVRPLLTTGARSAVLVTSRRDLVALPGAHPVRLGPLDPSAARRMVPRGEPEAVDAVIEACARLPLALHIAAMWLVARPHRSVADLAALLANDSLGTLVVADLSMRASIAAHVGELRLDDRRLAGSDALDRLVQANLHDDTHGMNRLVRQYLRHADPNAGI